MAQLQRVTMNPDAAPKPVAAYSMAVKARASELVFIAGQVAMDRDGNIVGKGDAAAQTRQVFRNLGAVLEGVGAGFSNVLEFTIYVVGRESVQPYMQARSEVFKEIYPDGGYPASTLLVISGLAREEFLVEIKAVAAL